MMKRKRLISLILAPTSILLLLFSLSGCGSISYSAFYDKANTLLRPEYIEENRIAGRWDNTEEQKANLPSNRTLLICDQTTLNRAFLSFPDEVDFSRQTVVVHMFVCYVGNKTYKIQNIKMENDTLYIDFSIQKTFQDFFFPKENSVRPYQRSFYIVVDIPELKNAMIMKK